MRPQYRLSATASPTAGQSFGFRRQRQPESVRGLNILAWISILAWTSILNQVSPQDALSVCTLVSDLKKSSCVRSMIVSCVTFQLSASAAAAATPRGPATRFERKCASDKGDCVASGKVKRSPRTTPQACRASSDCPVGPLLGLSAVQAHLPPWAPPEVLSGTPLVRCHAYQTD